MPKKAVTAFAILFISVVINTGCGGAAGKGEGAAIQAEGNVLRGYELAEQGDFGGALAEFQTEYSNNSSPAGRLRIGYVLFLEGDFLGAKSAYEDYLTAEPDLPSWDRDEVNAEVKRIDEALAKDRQPQGASLAKRRLRGDLARLRAEQAISTEEFGEAFSMFEIASQYSSDPELSFEAGLAASKVGANEASRKHFKIYLAKKGFLMSEERSALLRIEVGRLSAVLSNQEPEVSVSLADKIYADREGRPVPEESKVLEPMPSDDGGAAETGDAGPESDHEEEVAISEEKDSVPLKDFESAPAPLTKKQQAVAARKARAEERRKQKKEAKAKREAEKKERVAKRKAKAEERRKRKKEAKAKRESEKKARIAKRKAKAEERRKQKEEAKAKREAKKKTDSPTSNVPKKSGGFHPATDDSVRATPANSKRPTLNVILTNAKSPDSSVRLQAASNLTAESDAKAVRALEDMMLHDKSMQVRLVALDALVSRNSKSSVEAMRKAASATSKSSERARIRRAIRRLMGSEDNPQ